MGEEDLRGTSLRVYLHVLSSGRPKGVREIARELGIPVSTAHYHLRKLRELGLVRELPEGFTVSRRVGVEGLLYVGNRVVPRLAVYSAFFAGVSLGLLIVTVVWGGFSIDRAVAMTSSLAASLLTALEARRTMRALLGPGREGQ